MCGLVGWVGDDPKKFNKAKFDIVGVWNEERGIHSCGVATDGNLYKGVDKKAKFRDFIASEDSYKVPEQIPVVIGHTRKATGGAHSESNAHPFKFTDFEGENKDAYVIGAHNGVIRNDHELARKYNIDPTGKIDSEILLEILSKGGDNYQVLVDYRGFAALLIYSSASPDSLWVFRGASREYSYAAAKVEPERPLFFYQEDEGSMYISSIEKSLLAISDDKDKVKEFTPNYLYHIQKGKIVERHFVDRSNSTQSAYGFSGSSRRVNNRSTTSGSTGSSTSTSRSNTSSSCGTDNTNSRVGNTTSTPSTRTVHSAHLQGEAYKSNNLFYEKAVIRDTLANVYYENLRFKDFKGALANGYGIFLKDQGFYLLSEEKEETDKMLKDFSLDDEVSGVRVVFGDCSKLTRYYFYEGICLCTELDYTACRTHLSENGKNPVDFVKLSHMSRFPILDITRKKSKNDVISPNLQHIIYGGHMFSGVIDAFGSFCSYTIKNGTLHSTIAKDKVFNDNNANHKILDVMDGDMIELNEEDSCDVFDESISNHLEFDDTQRIIQIKDDITESLVQAQTDIEDLDNKENSEVVKMMSDFVETSITRFDPIRKGIEAMQEEHKPS